MSWPERLVDRTLAHIIAQAPISGRSMWWRGSARLGGRGGAVRTE